MKDRHAIRKKVEGGNRKKGVGILESTPREDEE